VIDHQTVFGRRFRHDRNPLTLGDSHPARRHLATRPDAIDWPGCNVRIPDSNVTGLEATDDWSKAVYDQDPKATAYLSSTSPADRGGRPLLIGFTSNGRRTTPRKQPAVPDQILEADPGPADVSEEAGIW
jgi:hypothetical protein